MSGNEIDQITEELKIHAAGTKAATDFTNLSDYYWMLQQGKTKDRESEIWQAIEKLFSRLNQELNKESAQGEVRRSLAYAINQMIGLCLDYAATEKNEANNRRRALTLGWQISAGWDAVLAGDIDDISEHVELEGSAREIP
jgi:hypothetical protein